MKSYVMIKESLLAQKDLLLAEMSHRVANSLQIIASILLKAQPFAPRRAGCNLRMPIDGFYQ